MKKTGTLVRRYDTRGFGTSSSSAAIALPLMLAYAAALVWAVSTKQAPWWVLPACAAVNLIAFYTYWVDKHAAAQRQWRIAENTLHAWSLAGGWGGAWCAQQILRHKNRKSSFMAMYWGTVMLHCVALAACLSPAMRAKVFTVVQGLRLV